MWICASYLNETFAVIAGAVFFIGRILFFVGYRSAPEKRAAGFVSGWLASVALVLGGAWGVISSLL